MCALLLQPRYMNLGPAFAAFAFLVSSVVYGIVTLHCGSSVPDLGNMLMLAARTEFNFPIPLDSQSQGLFMMKKCY